VKSVIDWKITLDEDIKANPKRNWIQQEKPMPPSVSLPQQLPEIKKPTPIVNNFHPFSI